MAQIFGACSTRELGQTNAGGLDSANLNKIDVYDNTLTLQISDRMRRDI